MGAAETTPATASIALLGDSSLANLAHVGPPELITQLRALLPDGWRAHLAAVDGARVADVHRQLAGVPAESTHLVVSVGGNDAIALTANLRAATPDLGSALAYLDGHRRRFAERYASMLGAVCAVGRPTIVCTLYQPRLEPPVRNRVVATLVALLNDAIVAAAVEHGASVLDLRPLSRDPANFVSPIELNHRGAGLLAASIVRVVRERIGGRGGTVVAAAGPG